MQEFFTLCFSWPALPATVLLLLISVYWLLRSLGALDWDGFGVDLDIDGQSESFLSIGLTPLKFLNIGEVPLMLWMSIFALSWWTTSMLIYGEPTSGNWTRTAQAVFVSGGIGLLATKLLTQPLRGRFQHIEPHTAESLVGCACVITTSEATPEFGQARYETGAAPLLLNVRTQDVKLAKGDVAEIVDFDPERRVYLIKPCKREVANG